MYRFLSLIGSVLLLTCAPLAKAHLIEDVIIFNRALNTSKPLIWSHDLTRYGFVPGSSYSQFSLTLELRDLQDAPGKEDIDRPFFMLAQGPGRSFGRVVMEDLVVNDRDSAIHINAKGIVRPMLTIMEGDVWIGRAIVRVNIPERVVVSEPGSLLLLALGGLLCAVRLRAKVV